MFALIQLGLSIFIMDIIFRFQQALQTPLGDLLVFLVITTLTLSFFYLYFWARFKKSRNTLLKYYSEFKRVQKRLKEITFIEMGQADFFGKSQIVSFADGKFGKSTIFYPELCSEGTIHRFRNYHLALQQNDQGCFPKNQVLVQNNLLVNIETQYIKRDGKSLINFANFCSDSSFTISEKEFFLMNIAHTLEALHQTKTVEGEPLYHGFLLPQSFYLTVDMVKRIAQTYLAHHGCVFALGPERFNAWLHQILKGRITIDSKIKKELEAFLFICSPEQKNLNSVREVSTLSDFYSFGALSVYLFTGSDFKDPKKINFELLPAEWRFFVKECLNENPMDRPQNFLELKEYFSQPELELAQDCFSDEAFTLGHPEQEQLSALKPFFEQAHKAKREEPYFNEKWHQGYAAIHRESWDEAFNIYQEMMKEDIHAFNAHLGLALTYFHKGDQEKAKYHYLQAKKIDGKKIGSFHRLIAFEI